MNRIALFYLLEGKRPEMEELLSIDSIAKKEMLTRFDLHGLMIEHWYDNPYLELPRNEILKNVKKLRAKNLITSGEYYKLMINYHLASANYHRLEKEYKKERSSVNYVFSHFNKATLSPYDALVLANFLVYHLQLKKAVKLLKPYANRANVSDDLLFYYLSIAFFDKSVEKNEAFERKMKLALDRDEARFCKLFGFPAISFQLLRNHVLKQYYCDNCSEKIHESDEKSIIGDEDLNPHLIDTDTFGK